MSLAANGKQQKRIGKKQLNVSTAAVYPILQENNAQTKNSKSPIIDSLDTLDLPTTDAEIRHGKAQCIHGRAVAEHTIASSVVELVSEVIPQSGSQHNLQSEPICWVKIQKCVCDFRGHTTTFVIVIGLARGYQIWTMLENGDCEEVASERKGPFRCAHLLPFTTEGVDNFCEHRPLFAMVDGNPMSSDHKHCTMSFLSLKVGKIAHSLDFVEPIIDVDSTAKFLLVVLCERLVVCDHETLTQRFSIAVPTSNDGMPPCYAVSDALLAFVEQNLDKQKQSCGGVMFDSELSYGGQVMNAAKSLTKTMASIGESFVSSFTSSSQCKKVTGSVDSLTTNDTGIVSVINVNNLSTSNDKKNSAHHYIAHFIAHDTSPVGYLAMGNGGNLLLTGAQGSTTFHLFILRPHSTSVRLSSVQHIYTLHRGNSAAKVLHSAFSADNRWLSIITNHGTTHIYAITPYGGPVDARTHCGKFVNKESRFQRSAGLLSIKQMSAVKGHNSANKSSTGRLFNGFKEHPALVSLPVMSRTSMNPRLTYYEPPIQLYSLTKLKHRAYSPENWSAWASDNTPSLLSSVGGGLSSRHHSFHGHNALASNGSCLSNWLTESSNRRMAVAFDLSFGSAALGEEVGYGGTIAAGGKNAQPSPLCLYVMNCEGIFTEHKVEIRCDGHHNSSTKINTLNGSTESLTSPNGTASSTSNNTSHRTNNQDVPVRAKVVAAMQWILRRNRGSSSVEVVDPPLPANNSLMRLCSKSLERDSIALNCGGRLHAKKEPSDAWLRQVEVVTYLGPHRRLWMGPQFSFGVYANSGHSSAQLYNPKDTSSNIDNSTFSSTQKCCPVLIEKNPVMANGFGHWDTSMSRIVCGSWSSDIVDTRAVIDDSAYASVKEKIEDAMREIDDPPPTKSDTKKKSKRRAPTAKVSTSSSAPSDSNSDLLNLSGMEL